MTNSACILNLTGEVAGATTIGGDQVNLLSDSLCFVEDGLLFLMQGELNYVFGVSLTDALTTTVGP